MMEERLYLRPCPFIKKELEHILKDGNFSDVTLAQQSEASLFNSEELVAFSLDLRALRIGCAHDIVSIKNILTIHHECIDLVIGKNLSASLQKEKHHILLPAMITHMLTALESGVSRKDFTLLHSPLVFDTGVHPQLQAEITKLQNLLGVSFTVAPISLDHLEQVLRMQLEIWRHYQNTALVNENLFYVQKEKANYAIILDFIGHIQRFETENKIIVELLDLVVMLSGNAQVHFLHKDKTVFSYSAPASDELKLKFDKWLNNQAVREEHWGMFRMEYREELLGTLFLYNDDEQKLIMLQTLLSALMNFTALAIDKLHNMNEIAHKKELEAIHAMVATYNHEINNPLSIATGYLNIAEKKQDLKYLSEVKDALAKITDIVKKISEITAKGPNFADYTKESQRIKID